MYSMVRYIYMGEYDYTVVDLNDVAKDIFARLPTTGKFYIGKCIVGSNYDFIACNSSLSFGFICFFSYNIDGVYIYKRVLGKTYRQVAQWEVTAI